MVVVVRMEHTRDHLVLVRIFSFCCISFSNGQTEG